MPQRSCLMKVSDYIVEYLISQGITDVFGYPGGMVTHLMDSLGKKRSKIKTHITYHEQAAAFAACGYAQASTKLGVAFATSGPGATNLITGIANAYYDSIPTLFITGQVNTFESKGKSAIRQKGFQETHIVPMVKEITKASFYVSDSSQLQNILESSFHIAQSGRKGPVLIDIPMDIFRTDFEPRSISVECQNIPKDCIDLFSDELRKSLHISKRPCLLIGNGIKIDHQVDNIRDILRLCPLPVVSSMLAVDVVPEAPNLNGLYYGFIGAYGNRSANFVVAKSDLIICLGTRLDIRQVGGKRKNFAPEAKIIRVDIDKAELTNQIRADEKSFVLGLGEAITAIRNILIEKTYRFDDWISVCQKIKQLVKYTDEKEPNIIVNAISKHTPDCYSVVADVGQHMVWVAQSFKMKPNQRLFLSGGMGSMGYALPASIGVYYATRRPVLCFVGDGGIQMNIQELQFLVRERIPIKIFVLNNSALGMIRHFQEMYFESRFFNTVLGEGYSAPDFAKIAKAYGIQSNQICKAEDLDTIDFDNEHPQLFDIRLKGNTYVFPKLEYGKPNQDQEPLLDRSLYNKIMEL